MEPGTSELAWLTGSAIPDDIISPGPAMWMEFLSDVSTAGTGYSIAFMAVKQERKLLLICVYDILCASVCRPVHLLSVSEKCNILVY